MPKAVYMLGLLIFAMTTSEFMVGGMMPALADEFGVSIPAIGYLISAYAIGMVIGGPILTIGLLKLPRKQALLTLSLTFLVGQIIGAMSTTYEVMMVARIITGVSSAAGFAVSISICASLVSPQLLGRASSIVLGGLMVATVMGLPIATLISQQLGWRTSFWAVAVLVLVAGVIVQWILPQLPKSASIRLRDEFTSFKNPRLWAAFTTSGLIIAATFAAFSYFTPIFTEVTRFSPGMVPVLLSIYGAATVMGNMITGRLADRFTMQTMFVGLILIATSLFTFALFADVPIITIIAVVVLGFVGVPMNPPMATRVMRTANTGTLVNSIHGSVISLGVVVGSLVGGMTIDAGWGLVSPLWVGFILAGFGLLSLLPFLKEGIVTQSISISEVKQRN